MPSTMIHLLCAADYAPEMDPVFCVGCIAPDCIDVREFKDHTHFRDIPTEARPAALRDFARGLDLSDPFLLGTVFHLFADYTWDVGPQKMHRDSYTGEDWFHDYRREITLAGREIYRTNPWCGRILDEMVSLPESAYFSMPEYPAPEIKRFLLHARDSASAEGEAGSAFFTRDLFEKYARNTSDEFTRFLEELGREGES